MPNSLCTVTFQHTVGAVVTPLVTIGVGESKGSPHYSHSKVFPIARPHALVSQQPQHRVNWKPHGN